ncbi:hypothetical protein RFI_25773 [Reticulomyxa filosa]|uniref:Transmembrane protein n=1 Tax=Reticulomyxa filosa TaxID=46433 RepID=X6MC58_RETFI|nr:hypothetical protein RFI_25773 [Reticulomyxa filosa]|eukprot:ETO11603.1 hypothetical protein RFI_25773 [Reticulomyxa filosa]
MFENKHIQDTFLKKFYAKIMLMRNLNQRYQQQHIRWQNCALIVCGLKKTNNITFTLITSIQCFTQTQIQRYDSNFKFGLLSNFFMLILLLLLGGFDEIEKNTNLQPWLQHYTSNENYSIMITNQTNTIHKKYYNNESNTLIKKSNNSSNLKLLSHTPLQDKQSSSLDNDKWDDMTLLKLYKTLLKSYMKWNWMKLCAKQQTK